MNARADREITGRHVLAALCGFFGVILIVNGVFLYFALTTFHGLENPNAYQDGVNYNKRIEAAESQAALGWGHRLKLDAGERIAVTIRDIDGKAVNGLRLSGAVRRPVGASDETPLFFDETADAYVAPVGGLGAGSWIVWIEANAEQGASYRIKERLWLKPNS